MVTPSTNNHTKPMAARTTTDNASKLVTISRWRINLILLVAVLIAARVFVRLGEVQIAQHATLAEAARNEISRTETIQPRRGVITDRAGNALAIDVDRESLYVDTRLVNVEDAPAMALAISGLTDRPSAQLLELLLDKPRYHLLARWLSADAAETMQAAIDQNDWAAFVLTPEPKRIYPQGEYAAQLIGAVNNIGDGISGVEAYFDTELKGITGTLKAEWDGGDNPIWLNPPETQPATDGVDIQLTIDPLIQHLAEDELKKTVDDQSATGGTVIVIEVKTGAIRGMATYPSYDPNRYGDFDPALYSRSPAVTDVYEPGSTFKMFTAAAGMQTKAFTADTQVNDTGIVARGDTTLANYDSSGHGLLNADQMLYYSSNVAALQFAELIGAKSFYRMANEFGFGQLTGVEIAGESAGIVPDADAPGWGEIVLSTNGYGQGIAATPLQMVQLAATIANDGKRMKPYLVERQCMGEVCQETTPTLVNQPIDRAVAWTVRRMLVNSANHYSGVVWGERTGDYSDAWLVPGFQVGAKTGTASIPDGRGGLEPFVIGSVLGFAPAEDARYAVLVKIDRPQKDPWGLLSSIPVYQRVVDQLMRYERLAPDMALVSSGQEPYVNVTTASR
ncbi:MAG: penicillin-binding protein 2 [Roseiflexaceae bacterium]|nr:penicillin-binding protein 2 [Roseiflexaceae bacterium]